MLRAPLGLVSPLGRAVQVLAARRLQTSLLRPAASIKMPSLSPTMEEGTIVKWHKAPGDEVMEGDVMCDIQTDKAVMSMEATEEGTVAKIVTGENITVKVGQLIALVAEDGEDWNQVAAQGVPAESAAAAGASHAAATPAGTSSPAATGGSTPGTAVNLPSLSPTMEEGVIVKWHKKEGEPIAAGDVLCEIQTDKAVVAMEADEDGIVAKILVEEGAGGKVGTLIALMVEEGADWKDVAIPSDGAPPAPASPPSPPVSAPPVPATSGQPTTAAVQEFHFTHPAQTGPAAALLLSQYNLNPSDIQGSGPKGNLTKADVVQYIKGKALPTPAPPQVSLPGQQARVEPASQTKAPSPVPKPTPTSGYSDVELSNMRRVIAKRLTDSKQMAPHGYSSATSDITAISKLRQEYIRSGFKVSINDFIIKAVGTALQYIPQLNSNVVDEELKLMDNIDISVAVATPAGLITPIVKGVDKKSVQEISADVKELAGRAKENKLKLDEFQGGTFTISNLGMFGITEFTAIINAPQVAILAVGGGQAVIHPETMQPTTMMTATLSFDRRYIDEAGAADFMKVFQAVMERPELLGTGYLPSVKLDRIAAAIP